MNLFYQWMDAAWSFYLEAAVYMLFGFIAAGLLHAFIRPEVVSRWLGRGRIRPVLLAALAGIPIPLCSCGVVPAATGLKRSGANNGATLSFMIATPETGVDSIPVTYALMDPVMTVIRPVAALVTAVVAGIVENFLPVSPKKTEKPTAQAPDAPCSQQGCGCGPTPLEPPRVDAVKSRSWQQRVGDGLRFAFEELLGDIGKWFLLGIAMAALISILVPDRFIETQIGQGWTAMLMMLAAGVPMYVCATASTPIAAALIMKGLSPGAALVFLLVGPATNIATLTMVAGFLGRRTLVVYLLSIVVCSLGMGFLTDLIYSGFHLPPPAMAGAARELIPRGLQIGAALLLSFLMALAAWKSRAQKKQCRTQTVCNCG